MTRTSILPQCRFTLILVALLTVFVSERIALGQVNPSWIPTGNMNTARANHTASLLPNGKVLVAGGWNLSGSALNSAELYDPLTGTWNSTGSLNTARSQHTATLLPSGKVLIAGGANGGSLNSAELYDPATGTWSSTGSLNTARIRHSATLLSSGKVLIAGGFTGFTTTGRCPCINFVTDNTELYDPATGTWSVAGHLNTGRSLHTATLLEDGQVLVAGGTDGTLVDIGEYRSESSAELFDPATGTWNITASLNEARNSHTATRLPNGRVLAAAGYYTGSAELYDPSTGAWSVTASINAPRADHTATLLPSGNVLLTGGWNYSGSIFNILSSADIFDAITETWSATASLNIARLDHTATLLPNGKALVAGGRNDSAELFDLNLFPSLSISDVTVTEGNAGTINATFEVKLSEPSTEPVTVTFSTANRTATAGSDYVDVSGSLTFDPGETTKTITVVVNANDLLELDKTFLVNITSASNAVIADGQAVGTIINDDGALPERLSNISTRSRVLTGDNVMIGGFIIDGSTPKRVLVRSRGPSIAGAPFFVPGTLANPFVRIFSGPTVIAQNDNWQDSPNCPGFVCEGPAEIVNTGFDPCTPNPGQNSSPPSCALEAAILITLPPGAYTATVTGANGHTGVALVEVFEADASVVSELGNISTRAFVQSGDNVMIGGLIIDGSAATTVLLRARGPSMSGAPFFVPGTLANPFLQLFSGQTVIAQNDNWQDIPSCGGLPCGGAAQIAATSLDPCQPNPGQSASPPGCAQESTIFITLPPGAYTAIVSGVGGATGVGLVEVFELD